MPQAVVFLSQASKFILRSVSYPQSLIEIEPAIIISRKVHDHVCTVAICFLHSTGPGHCPVLHGTFQRPTVPGVSMCDE